MDRCKSVVIKSMRVMPAKLLILHEGAEGRFVCGRQSPDALNSHLWLYGSQRHFSVPAGSDVQVLAGIAENYPVFELVNS